MISSKISTVPAAVHASRSVSRKPGFRKHHPGVVEDRFQDDRGDGRTIAGEHVADAGRVVVLAHDDEVANALRDAGRRRDRHRLLGVIGREVVAPRDVVVPAVVIALELEDSLARGERASQPDGVEGRLGAGAAEYDAVGGRIMSTSRSARSTSSGLAVENDTPCSSIAVRTAVLIRGSL